jgi:hypothetical protein
MKIAKTENVMTINNSSALGIILGIVFTIVGILIIMRISSFAGVPAWVGYIFLIGILLILFVKSVKITIDKNASTITVLSKSMVKKSQVVYPFADIDRLEMRTFRAASNSSGNSNGVTIHTPRYTYGYQFFLMTKTGKEIDIQGGQRTSYQENIFSSLYVKNKQIADNVATFVNVPVVEVNKTASIVS